MSATRTLLLTAVACLAACQQNRPGSGGDTSSNGSALLVVDVNRDGVVDATGTTDDDGRNDFTAQRGAVVLANIDDDDSDGKLDNSDDKVNGDDDTKDLSLLVLKAQPRVAASVTGTLTVDGASAPNVHLFRVNGDVASAGSYSMLPDPSSATLSNDDLRAGATFAVEATSVVTSAAAGDWDGRIHIALNVGSSAKDSVVMRVAPVLFQFNTANTRTVYYTDGAGADTTLLTTGMDPVCQAPVQKIGLQFQGNDWDQWTQDFFDLAHMTKPGPNGTVVDMTLAVRSAQPWRDSGATVLHNLLGPDFGNIYIHGPQNENSDGDSMNSFGNWDVIPPYEKNGTSYPLGRNVWGSGSVKDEQPNPAFVAFVKAQEVQPNVTVDSSWLTVGHIDEFFSWVKTNTPRGWGMLVASPSGSRDMLLALQADGHGSSKLFVGKREFDWSGNPDGAGNYPEIDSARTVDQILADADLLAESQYAQMKIDDAVEIMQTEVGLADSELTPMPFLYGRVFGKGLGYQPGTVNLLFVNGGVAVPKPFGPIIDGHDPFEQDVETHLTALGMTVSFVDDWDLYHIEMGEVHCGTNVVRDMPLPWWESGR